MKNFKVIAGKTGATTKVFIDGKKVGNCTRLVFEAQAGGLNKVVMEFFPVSVEIENGEAGATLLRTKPRKPKKVV